MTTKTFELGSAFALAIGTVALTSQVTVPGPPETGAALQSDQPAIEPQGQRLNLGLPVGTIQRYLLRHETWADAQAPPRGDELPERVTVEVGLRMEVERGEDDGRRWLTVTLQPRSASETEGASAAAETVGAPPPPATAWVYDLEVDADGLVRRLRPRLEDERPRLDDEAGSALEAPLPEATLRRSLELVLGSGLHGRELVREQLYAFGASASGRREAVLRRDGALDITQVTARFRGLGAGRDGRRAQFELVLPDPRVRVAEANARRADATAAGVAAGDAAYSVDDGLLTRLSFLPRPPQEGAANGPPTAARLEIERVQD